MKQLILFVFWALFCAACKKQSNRPQANNKPYVGVYDGNSSDTAYVSQNGEFAKIRWLYANGYEWTADSILVQADTAFTVNEYLDGDPQIQNKKAIGRGSFLFNRIVFNVNIEGGFVIFDGIKR